MTFPSATPPPLLQISHDIPDGTRFTPDDVIIPRNRLCHHKGKHIHGLQCFSKLTCAWNIPATSQHSASVQTDHPSLSLTLPRLHPPHAHFRSRLLLLNVSFPSHQSLIFALTSCDPPSLPKGMAKESTVAILASVLGGFGTVAMFCTVGVYV